MHQKCGVSAETEVKLEITITNAMLTKTFKTRSAPKSLNRARGYAKNYSEINKVEVPISDHNIIDQ